MVTLKWGCASDIGRMRSINEDSVLATPRIFAVADGMGGHSDGEVASRLAIDRLAPLADLPQLSRDDIAYAIREANQAILAMPAPDDRSAGTTISGIAVVVDAGIDHWLVFNVGDSRVYRWRDGELSQVTTDHSEVQELVDDGVLTAEEARASDLKNIVTRALGSTPPPEIDWWLVPITPGERFVICSDGVSSELADGAIAGCLRLDSADAAADALVRAAVDAGGRDNVSAIVVEVVAVTDSNEIDEDTKPRLSGVGGG